MKKIALLLAALLVLGMLAGCNAEEEKKPDHVVTGYDINLYTGEGWSVVEDSGYDMQLTKDGITMSIIGFTAMDFVDMPTAEDLYLDCNNELFEEKTGKSVKEKESSYEKNGNKIISTLFSAKNGDKTELYYCFMVSFADEAESKAWVCFSGAEKTIHKKKADLKKLVETMTANGEYISPEELEELIDDSMGEEVMDGEVAEDDYEVSPDDGAAEDVPATESSAEEENPTTGEPEVEEETKPEDTKPQEETTGAADEKDAPDATTSNEASDSTATTEASTEATE